MVENNKQLYYSLTYITWLIMFKNIQYSKISHLAIYIYVNVYSTENWFHKENCDIYLL